MCTGLQQQAHDGGSAQPRCLVERVAAVADLLVDLGTLKEQQLHQVLAVGANGCRTRKRSQLAQNPQCNTAASQATYDQGRVLDLVLAVWVGAVLEQEGGVLHQTSRCCQEERRLTQRGALLHRLSA